MKAEYPYADWVEAHPSRYRRAGRRIEQIRHIVIHGTDGRADPYAVAEMWTTPGKTSAHFVVGQTAGVIQCVRLLDVAWHAHDASLVSIGIEHCARTPGELGKSDPGLPPTRLQYEASARLVSWLCAALGLEPDRRTIQGHAEIDHKTTHTKCPLGTGWDWELYMGLVAAAYYDWTGRR